jgi:porin
MFASRLIHRLSPLAAAGLYFACSAAAAEGQTLRDRLAAHGTTMDVELTADAYTLVDGGIDPGFEFPVNLDVVFNIDTARARLWDGGTLRLYFLGTSGGDPTERTGDIQTATNIEAFDTFKLYEAAYEHSFQEGRLSMLVGLHDMNSDFYTLDHAGLFQNSSFGIGPDVSQTAPSIFPTTALGTRLKWNFAGSGYLATAVYDGVPGDPEDEHGTHVKLGADDGLFAITEAGLVTQSDLYTKLAVGAWRHSARFVDLAGEPRDANSGIYLLAERDLWRSDAGRGVGVFAQLGHARSDRNLVSTYASAGMTVTGIAPLRPADTAGIAIAHARGSSHFHSVNPGMDRAETVVEMSYRFAALDWLVLQPDVQYIHNPGLDPSLDSAWVASLRMQFTF